MRGMWQLFQITRRIFLLALGGFIVLSLAWAFLPFPSGESDGDDGTDYSTKVLLSGKTLTRVYEIPITADSGEYRQGFALTYGLTVSNLTLSISGCERQLPIIHPALLSGHEITEEVDAVVRVGDQDGANLPWFPPADAILLYWWIQKESATVPLVAEWSKGSDDLQKFTVWAVKERGKRYNRGVDVLSLEIQGQDISTITARAPPRPDSSSPSRTYPARVAIITIIAPTAVFVSDILSAPVSAIMIILYGTVNIVLNITPYVLVLSVVAAAYLYYTGRRVQDVITPVTRRLQTLKEGVTITQGRWRPQRLNDTEKLVNQAQDGRLSREREQ